MSKIKFTVSILIILLLSAVQVLAQGWNAVLNINPYPSPYISDWQNNPASLGSMTIYRTGNTSEEVNISVDVTLNNVGEVLNGVTEPFTIPPTPSYIVDNTKILKIDNPSYPNSDLKSKTIQSGRLPEGEYTVCITVRNMNNVVLVSNVCSNFTILYPQPPQLIAPFSGDSLDATNKYPTFAWTPVIVPPNYQIKYSLRIAEILPSQTAQQALSANVLQYENDNITTSSLIYPIDALPLDTGKTYAWQVQVLDQNGFPPTQNYGKSEIYTFSFKHPVIPSQQVMSGNLPVSFDCGCNAPSPTSNTVKTNFTLSPDTVLKIGKFNLKITKITKQPGSDGKFSGEGTIPFPLINSSLIPLKIIFNDIQINSSKQVISGYASAEVSNNFDFLPTAQPPEFNTVPLTITDVQNLKQYFNKYPSQLASQAENAKNSFGFDLPLGLDKQIGGKKIIIAITGMTFTPKNAAFDAAVELDLPDATPNAIALGARNICIDQYNICGQGTLFLSKDIDLNIGNGKLKLKSFNNSSSPADSGTYVVFDNKGFKNLHIQAEYDFPTSLIVQTDNVSPVAATITANANSWTDWIGSIKIDNFKINGLKDFTFIPGTAYYDHSDLQNPQNIPVKYISSNGSLWHGFFLPQLKIELPAIIKNNTKDQPLQISVNNLVIDNQGVSVDAVAKNILSIGDGSLSGWYYSIDSLSVEFINNSLSQSTMGGKVVLPISGNNPNSSGSQLNYTCNLTSPANKGMNLQFLIKPKDNVNFQLVVAKMNIDKSSTIEINLGGNGNYAKTDLSGTLSIGINKPKISFKAVKFQGLQIQTQKPYLTVKSLTAGFASPQKDVGGFPVSFKDIKPKIKGTKLGLSFDVDINLCKEIPKVPKGNFGLTIWGYIDYNAVTKRFSGGYSNTEIDSIGLDGQLGPVHIKGIVNFYDDQKLGNAIGGKVSVTMLDGLGLKAEVLFGKKDYYYWYVDGNFMLSVEDAIPLPGTPLRIFGFGGGAYYNLQQSKVPEPNEIFSKERAAAVYSPHEGTMGFLATIIIGSADGEALQANGTMQFEFNTSNGFAVSKVIFKVDAALLTPLMQKQKAMITGNGYIYLDFANEIYTAGVGITITVPKQKTLISGSGDLDLLINAKSKQWYFHIGAPEKDKRISVSILNAITLKAYFMMGDDIPGIPKPDVPSGILSGYNTTSRDPSIGLGTGIAFGASFKIDKHFTFLIFYGHLYAGLGFDIAIRKLSQGCSGSSNLPGINGWYAQGQLYAYGGFDAGLHVDVWFFKGNVSILKLDVAAIFSMSGPNPTWFKGWLHGGYSALDGLVHGEMSFNVVYSPNGKCEVPISNPLGGIPLITEVKPEGSGVSILSNAEASFTFPVKKLFTIDQIDNNGHKIVRSFRLLITRFDIYKGSSRIYGINNNGSYIISGNDRLAIYSKKIAFSPQSEYKIVVAVKAQEKKNGIWKDSYDGGKLVEDKRTQEFKTGDCIVNLFKNGAVVASYPFDRQRYLLQKEYNRGYILLSQAIPCLTKDPNYNLKAVFYSYGNKPEVQESNITVSGNYLYFNLPPLPNSTITMLAIVKRPKVTNNSPNNSVSSFKKPQNIYAGKVMSFGGKTSTANINTFRISNLSITAEDIPIYEYYFKTSKFNTLKEKLDASDYSTNAKKEVGYVGTYKLAEGFDYYDINGKVIAGSGAYPDRYIRPLVYVSEDITKDRWYKNYVEPLYDKAASTHKVLPQRSFKELALYGYYPPTGRIILYSPGIATKLTDAEIAATLPTVNHNHSGMEINTHKTNTFK